ncbi:MAG: flagellar biosynthesis protein FlhF [Lachnospiraceae bacterium]|nr:flagellar biosynthesis protein FlhF [Lachnospiraceae bacterium]MDE7183778.1 flagellar biosynthesis protein FlhF [Lachnospiraceae bacterium]
MIIKKFQGRTKEEALESARRELGANIVEMNVKALKPKGIMGLFRGTRFEVTVAREEENEKYSAVSAKDVQKDGVAVSFSHNESQGKIIPMKKAEEKEDAKAVGLAVADVLSTYQPETARDESVGERSRFEGRAGTPVRENGLEEKLDSLQNLIEKQLSRQDSRPQPEESKSTEEEKKEEDTERINFLKILYNKMTDNEINEKYANEMIDEIDRNCKADVTLDFMLSEIYQRMILKLGKPYVMEDDGKGPRVIFFVGPTGVGKTTTIAKIASTYKLEHRKKVAMLTADTYRIAAAEQLRTYANILEVPFRVVYTAKEIEAAVEDFREYDYIFVDTTGHSPNDEAQCENMSGLINSVDIKASREVFLVLSASTKYKDLMRITDTYKEITDYKLIFTKLDETSALGNIYNLKLYTGARLSYVTYGQNVPDDIEYFNPQSTVKQLLGGRR